MGATDVINAAGGMIPPEEFGAIGKWIIGTLIAAVVFLFGLLYKRQRPEIGVEGSLYAVSIATIQRQAQELIEKDNRIKELLIEGSQLHTSRNDADARAVRAETYLQIAREDKDRMESAIEAAQKDIDEMKIQRQRDAAYIVRLQQALKEANLPIPQEPEFN